MFYRQACYRGLPCLLALIVLSACGNSDSSAGSTDAPSPTGPLPIDDPLNVVIDVPDSADPEPVVVVDPVQPVSDPTPEPEPTPAGPESGITSAQLAQLPDDCLLTQDAQGVAYCFSPETRKYTAVNLDGNVLYEFNLPGDNATNSVKGLFIGPEESIHDVCLVADITVAVNSSEFEISCFQSSGAFVGTVPTLGTPPRYGDPIKMEEPQGVNVNNEALLVAQAPQGRAYVAGTRYSLDILADAGQLDAWQKQGSFIAIVEPIAGGVIATHLFTRESIVALEPSDNSLVVTFDSGERQTLDPNDLGPVSESLPANRFTLAPENLARSLPTLITILEGTQFEQFNNTVLGYTDAIVEQIDPAQRWPDTPLCPLSGPAGCEQTVVAAPLNVACSISGSVTVTFSTERITSGSTRNTTLRALWLFDDDCLQALDNGEQAATLRGEIETVEQTITAVPGNSNSQITEFFNFQLQPSNGQNTSVTGSWSNRDIQSSREGSLTTERLGNFSEILSLNGSDLQNASIGRSVVTSQDSSQFSVSDPDSATLGFSISNSTLGFDSLGLLVSTPLYTGFTQTLSGYRFSQTLGVIEMRANDGSNAMLTLSTDAPTDSTPSTNSAGQELVNYQMMHDGTETEFQSNTSGFYIPSFID